MMVQEEYGREQFVTCFDIGLRDERFLRDCRYQNSRSQISNTILCDFWVVSSACFKRK